MKFERNGKTFLLSKEIRDNYKHRLSFDALAEQTFGLSFEAWYKAGYWTERYQPYSLLNGEKVVANASVSIVDTIWQGIPKRYIQLGTVMTAPEYRNMGLAKFLINQILHDWTEKCDAAYLYANDSVLNFYPKFGFVTASEYQATIQVKAKNSMMRKLDMSDAEDIKMLCHFYQKSNPFSALPLMNCWGLLIFYCTTTMKDCVYYSEEMDAVVIAEKERDTAVIYDIYCENHIALADILGAVVNVLSVCSPVRMGFALKNAPEDALSLLQEENTTLFILEGKENVFKDRKVMFPLLSHA